MHHSVISAAVATQTQWEQGASHVWRSQIQLLLITRDLADANAKSDPQPNRSFQFIVAPRGPGACAEPLDPVDVSNVPWTEPRDLTDDAEAEDRAHGSGDAKRSPELLRAFADCAGALLSDWADGSGGFDDAVGDRAGDFRDQRIRTGAGDSGGDTERLELESGGRK